MAFDLGMDTNFFLHGGTALGEHFGEKITPLPQLKNCFTVIVFPSISISTQWAYQQISQFKIGTHLSLTEKLVEELIASDGVIRDFSLLHNDFDEIAKHHFPDIENAIGRLYALNAKAAHLCGSGGAVYGLFDECLKRDLAFERLKGSELYVWKADIT